MAKTMIRRAWAPLLLTIALLALWRREPSIVVLSGPMNVAQASLALPPTYIATSPISRILDGLTLLSNPQSIALWITIAVLYLAIVYFKKRNRTRTWKWFAFRLGGLIILVAIIEAAVAFAPRPMARLVMNDTNAVVIDFHSHTGFSHDGRKSFTVDKARTWHQAGGFDIAWITDHVTFKAQNRAIATNPKTAGEGTSLLIGVEGRYHRIFSTIMLDLDQRDSALLNKRGNLLPGIPASGREPVTIVATPNRNLDSLTLPSLDSLPHFVALELIDAAPRGLGQFDREEAKLRSLARNFRLTLVAATNNHGYGRTVAAWNVMTFPGWRTMSPDSLGNLIEAPLRNRRVDEVSIVARNRPHTHAASLPLTLPILAYEILAALSTAERISWLLWIWIVAGLIALLRPNEARESA